MRGMSRGLVLLSALMLALSATSCGHKGGLKTPSQAEADAQKKAHKAAKRAAEEQKQEQKKEKDEPPPPPAEQGSGG